MGTASDRRIGRRILTQVFYNVIHMFSTAGARQRLSFLHRWFWLRSSVSGSISSKTRIGDGSRIALYDSSIFNNGFYNARSRYSMLILGAAFVMVPAAMWPSIPLIVEKNRVGTAFGLTTTIQILDLRCFHGSTVCSGMRLRLIRRAW